MCFILISILIMCVDTLPECRVPWQPNPNATIPIIPKNFDTRLGYLAATEPNRVLFWLDAFCTFYFTVEFVLRVISAPSHRDFFSSTLNKVDLVALIATYFFYILNYALRQHLPYIVIESVGTIRVIRIFKLARHFRGLSIFYHTIKASVKELALLLVVFLIFVVMFGTFVFVMEQLQENPHKNDFKHMALAFWWALVTMTTVGYGDVVPRSLGSYMIAVFCTICGVLVIAMPVPIIVNNFALYYSHAQARAKMPKRKRRRLVGAADALKQQAANSSPTEGSFDGAEFSGAIPGPMETASGSLKASGGPPRKESTESVSQSIDSGIKTACECAWLSKSQFSSF